jgi:hypothetical protein
MSASSSTPAEIGSPEDGMPLKAKLKPIPSWKWSLVRSNASPVVLSDYEEFDWRSFSCQSSSTGIDALPLEVFEMIVKHLQLCDLKSLRLVNKAHLLRLTPQVFRHVTVHLHPKSFEGLHSIAAHSYLRHLVRSLTYDIRMVPQFKEEKIWQSVKERSSIQRRRRDLCKLRRVLRRSDISCKSRPSESRASLQGSRQS